MELLRRNNRILCTFAPKEQLEDTILSISQTYTLPYRRLFVLDIVNQDRFAITYDIDLQCISKFPENTVLLHRRKQSNTLYTINALNILVKSMNGGKKDPRFLINWDQYQNCILLARENSTVSRLDTKLYRIIRDLN